MLGTGLRIRRKKIQNDRKSPIEFDRPQKSTRNTQVTKSVTENKEKKTTTHTSLRALEFQLSPDHHQPREHQTLANITPNRRAKTASKGEERSRGKFDILASLSARLRARWGPRFRSTRTESATTAKKWKCDRRGDTRHCSSVMRKAETFAALHKRP